MSYHLHVRRTLDRPILAIQGLTLCVWLALLLCNPYLRHPLDPRYALAFVAMLGSGAVMRMARQSWQWRLGGFLSVIAFDAAFRLQLHHMGGASVSWMLPVAVTLSLGYSVLFSHARDYLLALACTWAIMLGWHDSLVPSAADLPLLELLVAAVTIIGLAMNHVVVTALRSNYAHRENDRRLAATDALTGLPNRRALIAELEAAVGARHAVQLAMLEIDDFERIGAEHGHHVGDAVLQALATELVRLDPRCRVGRLGGEEFGLLFEGVSQAKASERLQRLKQRIRNLRVDGAAFTCSVGLASLPAGGEVSDLLARADRALSAARQDRHGGLRLDGAASASPGTSAVFAGDADLPAVTPL
ncbi:GGDEF domain-containing protein [Xanthomonas sacchari]|uniref:diguanylate cyclase n=1 Tax=Xanthomonas sacchari TaxID=56458 RepID=A0A2P5Z9B2_9XANT|nr:GGDEF domain-containing protein [Xanthomonas sacchari]MDV0437655.1 GGDEF domain-containing protein [Xanthomonas sacchari]PPU85181.1 GGDEF domain-containing protein [Xanthomonas sacchari]